VELMSRAGGRANASGASRHSTAVDVSEGAGLRASRAQSGALFIVPARECSTRPACREW
jgi:hypothetical protein